MERLTLEALPEVSTSEDVAREFRTTVGALAQDRHLGRGLPYVKIGSRVRYLRVDLVAYLEASRQGTDGQVSA